MERKFQKANKKLELSPLQRKKNGSENLSMNHKIDNWLVKKGIISNLNDKSQVQLHSTDYDSCNKKSENNCVQQSRNSPKLKTKPIKQKRPIEKPLIQNIMETYVIELYKN